MDEVEKLINLPTVKEKKLKVDPDIYDLFNKPTSRQKWVAEMFRCKSYGQETVRKFCEYGTRDECRRHTPGGGYCKRLHFRRIIRRHTDEALGDCSFLNTCFHMDTCKYVHYSIDYPPNETKNKPNPNSLSPIFPEFEKISTTLPQWIQCDLRFFDMTVLGKFSVIMADPPWDIHMELPYGTMSDDEMRRLNIPCIFILYFSPCLSFRNKHTSFLTHRVANGFGQCFIGD